METDKTIPTSAPSKPASKPKPKSKSREPITFESREKEASMFKVMDIRPTRNFSTGRLEWEVPADTVELFEKHHFVMNGRIARKP